MQQADFDVNAFQPNAQSEEDKKLLVKFFVKPMPDQAASKEQGRPIFKDVEYIDIKIPGSRTGGACRPASFADKNRFPEHYSAFKQRVEAPSEGTPLAEWPLITRSLAEELAFHNVKTVEHLSTMADNHVAKFMGLGTLKAKAVDWLEQAKEGADLQAMKDELVSRDEKIAALEAKLDKLLEAQPTDEVPATELTSELDEEAPAAEPKAAKPRRARRKRKAVTDGEIQVDK